MPLCAARAARAIAQGTRPPAPAAMPGKKKEKDAPKGPQGSQWVQSAADAYDAAYHDMPAGRLPSPEDAAAAVAQVAPPVTGVGSSSDVLQAEVPLSQARLGAVALHRHSGEGLMATGFDPERHSVMVLGRPVQASPPSAASGCCDGCYLLPDSLSSPPSPQASPCRTEPFTVQCCVFVSGSGLRYVSSCGAQSLSPRAQPS